MSISAEVSEMNISKDDLEDDLKNLGDDLEDDLKNLGDDLEDDLENILEEIDSKEIANFPNEAYGNLMALVTKHKLNNASGNAIIKFFNKHAKLATSPLPKSIKQGREYMDKMNLPNFQYDKTCVIVYNNNEYYLHHRPLISCIKNILSISDISENFELTSKDFKVIVQSYDTSLLLLL